MNRRLWIPLTLLLLLAACQQGESTELPTNVPPASPEAEEVAQVEEAAQAEEEVDETAVDPTAEPESDPTPAPTDIPPTATPEPTKEMTICSSTLPENLYLYGDQSDVAQIVRQAIYEPLYSTLGYGYQPVGLAELPSIEAGTAEINVVSVQTGDRVVNGAGDPVRLQSGVQMRNAAGELITYDGEGTIELEQMTAVFEFAPLVWADGTPLTAADSVFSFNVAADGVTPADKEVIERTASYEARDEQTAVWIGLPGYIDRTYFLNAWTPLPSHLLTRFTANDLLTAAEINQTPIGYGPFLVEQLTSDSLVLVQNQNYYQSGLPNMGRIEFVLSEDGLADVMNGRCQLALSNTLAIDQTPDVLATDGVTPIFRQSLVFEHIDLGINPVPNYQRNHPDWFEDGRFRQALLNCIDRQRMIDELQFGQGVIYNAYVADDHPAFPETAVTYPYDPALGQQILDELGLIDTDEDGIRERTEVGDRTVVTPISITLGTDNLTPLRVQINEQVASDLSNCGIQVDTYELPPEEWYADGPFSPLFGRRFDMGTFAWLSRIDPPCNLYLTRNITGPEEQGFGGWNNVNATGWSNEAFDIACLAALDAFWGTADYDQNHADAIQIFTEELPMLPLFSRFELLLHEPTVSGIEVDATQRFPLWNAAALDWDDAP